MLLLDSYRLSGDKRYLDRARLHGSRIISQRVPRGSGWWYPYDWNYRLHSNAELYTAPWYSMMAQGQALSLFVRL